MRLSLSERFEKGNGICVVIVEHAANVIADNCRSTAAQLPPLKIATADPWVNKNLGSYNTHMSLDAASGSHYF